MDAFQILVVDDESALREIYQEALTDDGYNVDVAGSGREALGKLISMIWSSAIYVLYLIVFVSPTEIRIKPNPSAEIGRASCRERV